LIKATRQRTADQSPLPFVRWDHTALVPQVSITYDRAGRKSRSVRYEDVERHSKIHRTSVRGRCRFAHRFSRHVSRLYYLHELPFPVDQLVANRRQVCDYCFFGGPDKTTPLPL
jgi:hypothetical protein